MGRSAPCSEDPPLTEAELAGESLVESFPLAYIVRALKLPIDRIALLEGRQHFELEGRQIGLVTARQVLAAEAPTIVGDELPVIVIGEQNHTYGLVVDRLLGECELVVQPLDAQLGKIKDIADGALMEDGAPVLIVDAANDYLVKLPDKIELVARIRLHSKACLNQIQRDEAHRNLSESRLQLVVSNNALALRIGELQVVRDELSRMVSTDSLTGLSSRRRWLELTATEFIRSRRYGRPRRS